MDKERGANPPEKRRAIHRWSGISRGGSACSPPLPYHTHASPSRLLLGRMTEAGRPTPPVYMVGGLVGLQSMPQHTSPPRFVTVQVDEEVENLKEEQSQLEEVKEVADKIQQRFHVKETPGSSVIKLHGKDGAVKVVVQFDVQVSNIYH